MPAKLLNKLLGRKVRDMDMNYTNPRYGLSLVDTLWNAG